MWNIITSELSRFIEYLTLLNMYIVNKIYYYNN
jgi:hypothetical protein